MMDDLISRQAAIEALGMAIDVDDFPISGWLIGGLAFATLMLFV